jgi:hypothetical protein
MLRILIFTLNLTGEIDEVFFKVLGQYDVAGACSFILNPRLCKGFKKLPAGRANIFGSVLPI